MTSGAAGRTFARMSEARGQIENLLYRYAELIDEGRFDALGELFAHAELLDPAGAVMARGACEATRNFERSARLHPETGTPRTKHVTTNLLVEVDEAAGTASCRSNYVVFQQTATLPLQPIITGHYHDRFEREGGRWRFASRRYFVDQVGDLSQHLLYALPPR